jgi:hypothetical protein
LCPRLDLAPEGHRKLAGGKHRAAPGGAPRPLAPRPGRWKVISISPTEHQQIIASKANPDRKAHYSIVLAFGREPVRQFQLATLEPLESLPARKTDGHERFLILSYCSPVAAHHAIGATRRLYLQPLGNPPLGI